MEPYKPFRIFASVSTSLPDWNHERLSEASAHLDDIPLQDMERWVNRSTQERRQEVAKKGKIINPMNCFMLYRSAYSERVRVLLGASEPGAISEISISRVTGASWKNESGRIRQKYKALAMIDRQNHGIAFPKYDSSSRRPCAAILNGNKSERLKSLPGSLEHPNDSDAHLSFKSDSDQFSLPIEARNGCSDSPDASQAEMLLLGPCLPLDQQWRNHELPTDLPLNYTKTPTLSPVSQEIIPTYPHFPSCSLAQSQWNSMQSSPCTRHSVLPLEKMRSYKGDEMKHLIEPIKQRQPEMTLLEDFDPIMPNIFSDIVQNQLPQSNSGGLLNRTFNSFNAEEDSERSELVTEYAKKPTGQIYSYSKTTTSASTKRTLENLTHVGNAAPVIEERPFKCREPGCGWQFKRRGHLKRHMNIHKGTSFFCSILGCDRRFTRNDNLRAHIKRHMKKGGRNFYVPELANDSTVFDSAVDGR